MTRSPARRPRPRAASTLPWIVRAAAVAGLAVLLLFDAVVSGSAAQVAYLVVVTVLGALGVRGVVAVGIPGLVSIAATGLALAGSGAGIAAPFALSEGAVLLLGVVVATRRIARPRDGIGAAVLVVATLALPLRLLSADTLTFGILLLAAVACALALGAVLRNLDAERRLALAVATQRERDGLARDLHDDFTNRVTGVVLLAQASRRRVDAPGSELDDELARIEEAGGEALASMRRWVRTLRDTGVERDPELDAAPDPADGIRALLDRWEATAPGRRASFHDATTAPVPLEVQATAARIVQESVTNATRHAPAARWIEVTLAEDADADAVVLRVVSPLDAEPAADPVPGSPGLGLVGMSERAAVLGGRLDAGPVAGTWTVRAVLPREGAA